MFRTLNLQLLVCVVLWKFACSCDVPSATTVGGTYAVQGTICPGDVIFEETFDTFDLRKWSHEITLSGGGNWEFELYSNNRTNSFVDNGYLHIRPTLLADDVGEAFLSSGTLEVNGGGPGDQCTNPMSYGCLRTGTPSNILNPIKSARIRTVDSFYFKYGRLEVSAKTPSGDWLWPAIWMLPRFNQYGSWPASGEIDILESRGNKNLELNGVNIGTQQVSTTLQWGPNSNYNRDYQTHYEKNLAEGYDTGFHKYQLEWTPDKIAVSVDDVEIASVAPEDNFWNYGNFQNINLDNPWKAGSKMAPFDQEFYLIINLAVGGINYFDDQATNPGGKPWSNTSPTSATDFWNGRNQWGPTWNTQEGSSDFVVDYVKIFAI
ncbi:beta-1,3-glucan-binding protein-like [Cylas formicarius]|uniref:beta-1,3-glucan-binding protein-like n=1 Tax=Cylas formicarius TaxID=197179 RepID=UPI00295875E9|nr:beta-1,3-glucan-binding protein-like [Cylas formicarius]